MNSVADYKERTVYCNYCNNGYVKATRAHMREYAENFGLKFAEMMELIREGNRTGESLCPRCGGEKKWQEKF